MGELGASSASVSSALLGEAGGSVVAVAGAVVTSGAAVAFVDAAVVVAAAGAAEEAWALSVELAGKEVTVADSFWLAAAVVVEGAPAGGAGGTSVALDLLVQAPIFQEPSLNSRLLCCPASLSTARA